MSAVQDTEICMVCGEEYWYEFDCRTFEYTKLTMCKCDRELQKAKEFLKKKGLLKEFLSFKSEE